MCIGFGKQSRQETRNVPVESLTFQVCKLFFQIYNDTVLFHGLSLDHTLHCKGQPAGTVTGQLP